MRKELDEKLCSAYPKIFRDRHASMKTTCMCWGFDCGEGWEPLIDHACHLIQWHITHTRKERSRALRFNRILKRAIAGDIAPIEKHFTINGKIPDWANDAMTDAITGKNFLPVPDACPQVVAVQVKEKFGTLRFYVHGGDDYTDGVIRMAESMSAVMCEKCGNPGKLNRSGWISCRCSECRPEEESEDEVL